MSEKQDKREVKKLVNAFAGNRRQKCISEERLRYRWNLTDTERAHVKNCKICSQDIHFLYHNLNTTPAERREVMRKGLERGKGLTLAEIEEMFDPRDGLCDIDDKKNYLAENGQRVTENMHVKDCPCYQLIKLVNEVFGCEVLPYRPTFREKIKQWWYEEKLRWHLINPWPW